MKNEAKTCDLPVVIGVDVGSGSVRTGVFDLSGNMLAYSNKEITLFQGPENYVEQSGNEIWNAVCHSIKNAVVDSGVSSDCVAGVGFDATCSLVVVGNDGVPLPIGPSNDPERNIIVWMDHRATAQARKINEVGHGVLKYVGGKISPEMETPKLLWLKENRPDVYSKAWQFFDLADYLTWRSTGDLSRSVCTVTCKWIWLAHEKRWDADYFRQAGLEELADENFCRIGNNIIEPGTPCGNGLTAEAARQMGLPAGTPVAAGIIDAHAGGIGTLGIAGGATCNLAYVFGTSSCTMTSTEEPVFVPGIWGPYYSAMVPGLWLNEGGQSAAGAAIKHLITFHPAAHEASLLAIEAGVSLPTFLADQALAQVLSPSDAVRLADGLHVVPEFLGNRSPLADPDARAVIAGLGMASNLDNLVALYVAGLCGVGYGLRQIIEAQSRAGIKVFSVVISGGGGRHPLVRQLIADTSGCEVLTTRASEPVLLGSAILGAVAGGLFPSVSEAMEQCTAPDARYIPDPGLIQLHSRRYKAWQSFQHLAGNIRNVMHQ